MSLETNTKGSQRVNKPFGFWNINNKAKEVSSEVTNEMIDNAIDKIDINKITP